MIMTNSDSDDFLAEPQPRASKLSKKKKKNKENGLQKAHTSTQNDNPNINTCRHLSLYIFKFFIETFVCSQIWQSSKEDC